MTWAQRAARSSGAACALHVDSLDDIGSRSACLGIPNLFLPTLAPRSPYAAVYSEVVSHAGKPRTNRKAERGRMRQCCDKSLLHQVRRVLGTSYKTPRKPGKPHGF